MVWSEETIDGIVGTCSTLSLAEVASQYPWTDGFEGNALVREAEENSTPVPSTFQMTLTLAFSRRSVILHEVTSHETAQSDGRGLWS